MDAGAPRGRLRRGWLAAAFLVPMALMTIASIRHGRCVDYAPEVQAESSCASSTVLGPYGVRILAAASALFAIYALVRAVGPRRRSIR